MDINDNVTLPPVFQSNFPKARDQATLTETTNSKLNAPVLPLAIHVPGEIGAINENDVILKLPHTFFSGAFQALHGSPTDKSSDLFLMIPNTEHSGLLCTPRTKPKSKRGFKRDKWKINRNDKRRLIYSTMTRNNDNLYKLAHESKLTPIGSIVLVSRGTEIPSKARLRQRPFCPAFHSCKERNASANRSRLPYQNVNETRKNNEMCVVYKRKTPNWHCGNNIKSEEFDIGHLLSENHETQQDYVESMVLSEKHKNITGDVQFSELRDLLGPIKETVLKMKQRNKLKDGTIGQTYLCCCQLEEGARVCKQKIRSLARAVTARPGKPGQKAIPSHDGRFQCWIILNISNKNVFEHDESSYLIFSRQCNDQQTSSSVSNITNINWICEDCGTILSDTTNFNGETAKEMLHGYNFTSYKKNTYECEDGKQGEESIILQNSCSCQISSTQDIFEETIPFDEKEGGVCFVDESSWTAGTYENNFDDISRKRNCCKYNYTICTNESSNLFEQSSISNGLGKYEVGSTKFLLVRIANREFDTPIIFGKSLNILNQTDLPYVIGQREDILPAEMIWPGIDRQRGEPVQPVAKEPCVFKLEDPHCKSCPGCLDLKENFTSANEYKEFQDVKTQVPEYPSRIIQNTRLFTLHSVKSTLIRDDGILRSTQLTTTNVKEDLSKERGRSEVESNTKISFTWCYTQDASTSGTALLSTIHSKEQDLPSLSRNEQMKVSARSAPACFTSKISSKENVSSIPPCRCESVSSASKKNTNLEIIPEDDKPSFRTFHQKDTSESIIEENNMRCPARDSSTSLNAQEQILKIIEVLRQETETQQLCPCGCGYFLDGVHDTCPCGCEDSLYSMSEMINTKEDSKKSSDYNCETRQGKCCCSIPEKISCLTGDDIDTVESTERKQGMSKKEPIIPRVIADKRKARTAKETDNLNEGIVTGYIKKIKENETEKIINVTKENKGKKERKQVNKDSSLELTRTGVTSEATKKMQRVKEKNNGKSKNLYVKNKIECPISKSSEHLDLYKQARMLQENIKMFKKENEYLRSLIENCRCSADKLKELSQPPPIRATYSGLVATTEILYAKCRNKDGIIAALAESLRGSKNIEQIAKNLVAPCLRYTYWDFDRCALYTYLRELLSSLSPKKQFSEKSATKQNSSSWKECNAELKLPSTCCPDTKKTVSAPTNFRVVREICNCLLVSWRKPEDISNVTGYKIEINGKVSSYVRSPTRTEAVLDCLDYSGPIVITLYAVGKNDELSDPVTTTYSNCTCDES